MRVLALDQSSRITGWAFFEDGNLKEFGKFDASSAGSDHGARLAHIRQKLLELIKKYNIEHVAFEEIQLQSTVGNNVATFKTLAYVQAIIIEMLYDLNIPYDIIASSSWKSSLGIKGRARAEQKRAAAEYVVDKYNIKPTQDEADAICIGTHFTQKIEGFDWSK